MYKINSGETAAYSETIVFVRLLDNGSYTPTTEAEAGGFCAKIGVIDTDEDGNEITTLRDTVYQFTEGSLKGDEPVGSFEQVQGAEIITEQGAELAAMEAGIAEGVNSIVDDE